MPSSRVRPRRALNCLRPWIALAAVAVLAALGFGAVACRKEPAAPKSAALSATPFEIEGRVLVPNAADSSGTQVFVPGSSLLSMTDSTGFFTLTDLPSGPIVVMAQRPGFASARLAEFDLPETGPGKRWVLPDVTLAPENPTGAAGVDANGRRVGSAFIEGRLTAPKSRGSAEAPDLSQARIELEGTGERTFPNAGGEFRISGLAPGTYKLSAKLKGFKTLSRDVEVADAGEPIELTLAPEGGEGGEDAAAAAGDREIIGSVELFTAQGDPVEDYTGVVVVLREAPAALAELTPLGSFRFRGLAPGVYTVVASWPGRGDDAEGTADVRSKPTVEVALQLLGKPGDASAPGALHGRVIKNAPNQTDMSGVQVAVAGTGSVAVTNAAGEYTIRGVDAGTHDLIAQAEGFETAKVAGVEVASGKTTEVADITLEKIVNYPVVLATEPANGARDVIVRRNMIFTVRFSKKMRPDSVKAAVTISPNVDHRLRMGRESRDGDDDLLTIEIAGASRTAAPRFDADYVITIGTGATDLEGLSLREAYRFKFHTGKAAVTDTIPAAGDSEALLNPALPLQIFFNAPIDPRSLQARDLRIRPSIVVIPTMNVEDDPITGWSIIHINAVWNPDTHYEVTIPRRVKTAGGQTISNTPYTLRFKTSTPTVFPPEFNDVRR